MSRKHMPLLIGGLVALVLALILGYLLVSAKSHYSAGADVLASVQSRLQRLSSRAVFPSEANVQTMGKQLDIYQDYLNGLYTSMRGGQQPAEPIDRDRFRRLLEDGLRKLLNDARTKSVTLAPNLAFGVQRYMDGTPPTDEELPRLVDQFQTIAALCEILYDAGIGELVSVDRTVFEKDALAAPVEEEFNRRGLRGRPDADAAAPLTELFKDPDGLFTKEHYVLSYRAKDAATWKVLQRLSQGTPFAVVTKLELSNPARPPVVLPKTEEKAEPPQPVSTSGWAAPGTAIPAVREEPTVLPRELRVVAGQELTNVRLEVDIYRFAEPASDTEKAEVNP